MTIAALVSLSALAVLAVACTSGNSFTPRERKILGYTDGKTPMRLWVVDDPKDSVLLRQTVAELTPEDLRSDLYRRLKAGMLATVNDPADPGVGIAAPQVGVGKRLVAVQRYDKPGEPFEFYANPVIEYYSPQKEWGMEGCLSVPSNPGDSVLRSVEVRIGYLSEDSLTVVHETVSGLRP